MTALFYNDRLLLCQVLNYKFLGVNYRVLLKNYTEIQIKNLIEIIKECVMENRYNISICDNKSDNLQFIEEYNMTENKCMEMLFELDYRDFCYGLYNMQDGVEKEDLYVFCPQRELYNIKGTKELVDIYLKLSILQDNLNEYRVMISFHKRNKAITYLFK